jgi:hypothetical protein
MPEKQKKIEIMRHYTLIYNALDAGSLLTCRGGFSGLSEVKLRPAFIHSFSPSLALLALCLRLSKAKFQSGYLDVLNFTHQYSLDEALVLAAFRIASERPPFLFSDHC